MSTNNAQQFIDAFNRCEAGDAKDCLHEKRRAAIAVVRERGLPTTRNENWRYTDIKAISRSHYRPAEADRVEVDRAVFDGLRFTELGCHELVFINGYRSADLSTPAALPDGVIVKDLNSALNEDADLLQSGITESCSGANGFTALNTAFIKQGAFIYIPDGVELVAPIHVFYLSGLGGLSGKTASPVAIHPRNIIIAGKGASATIIESYIGLDDASAYFNNIVSEVIVHDGANLEHYKIQQESGASHHIGFLFVHQRRDSGFISNSLALGGALARTDIHAQLNAPGADISMNGLYIVNGRRHIDNHTRVDHLAPATYSAENYRGILDGHGRGVFNGKVIVHKDAQQIKADQTNDNLLLSDDAEIDTKPELEIYADNVQCSHGATVGQLNEDMLFYLRARGVGKDTAKSLLTCAFAQEVINCFGLAPVRRRLEYLVSGQLPGADLPRRWAQ